MHKQRKPPVFVSILLFALLSAAPCGSAQAGTVVRIGGTGSGLPAMRLLATAYTSSHPDVSIRIVPSLGSPGGIKALGQGALDLAISARPLNASEQHIGATAIEYARTPFIFAAHKDVPKTDITTAELIDIYAGKTLNWPNGTLIRLILRPANDTDTLTVQRISPAVARAVQIAQQRPGMTLAATNDESANAIAKVPGALAVTTLTEMLTEKRKAKILSFNGVKPTLRTISDGRYPLVKRLFLVTPAKPSTAARNFAEFLRSAQARAILMAAGNLPTSEGKGH